MVMVVGPACVLTHGTAGISFIALQFSDSELIRKFGEAGRVPKQKTGLDSFDYLAGQKEA